MSIDYCPVVYPTWAEFNDFHAYTEYLEKTYASQYGIIKVVPPKGWKASSKGYAHVDSMSIPGPIEQNAYGRGGVYECVHISNKSMSVGEFRRRTKCFQHITDGLKNEEVEELFWKNVAFSSPLYAADIQLSLMDQASGSWNLNTLDSILNSGMSLPLPGINTPYCYFGSWKSFFCWHTEDMDLSAINFLHAGKTKYWYAIRTADRSILQAQAKLQFPSRFQKCSEHIRHKTTAINPYRLKAKYPKLQIHKQIQNPGQFILAFNGAYHCGFNSGFNIAQAVNYATLSWLKLAKVAKYCKCRDDSVRISETDLADQLIRSKFKNRRQVIQLYKSTRIQQQENKKQVCSRRPPKSDLVKDKLLLSKAFKHKKITKNTKKVNVKGEQFKIQNWAQCDKCQKWRRINFQIKKAQKFICKLAGSSCQKKEDKDDSCITLAQVKS